MARPHLGVAQHIPDDESDAPRATVTDVGAQQIRWKPVLGGGINEYARAALSRKTCMSPAQSCFRAGQVPPQPRSPRVFVSTGDSKAGAAPRRPPGSVAGTLSPAAPVPGTMARPARRIARVPALTVAAPVHAHVGGRAAGLLPASLVQRLPGMRKQARGRLVHDRVRNAHRGISPCRLIGADSSTIGPPGILGP